MRLVLENGTKERIEKEGTKRELMLVLCNIIKSGAESIVTSKDKWEAYQTSVILSAVAHGMEVLVDTPTRYKGDVLVRFAVPARPDKCECEDCRATEVAAEKDVVLQ